MKKILALLTVIGVMLIQLAPAQAAPIRTLTFGWSQPSIPPAGAPIASYKFYEVLATSTNLLGQTTNLTFTVTNVNLTTAHTYFVTAVDANTLESSPSASLTVVSPNPPGSLLLLSVQ